MSAVWQDALRSIWAQLEPVPAHNRLFRTRLLSAALSLDVFAALRAVDGAPSLVIETSLPNNALFEVGGMRLGVVAGERGPLLVLSLEDAGRTDLFTMVCADCISASVAPSREEGLAQFLSRLDAWRRFLRERRSGLSHEDTVGLIGELIVVERLVSIASHAWSFWLAPRDGLHDFERAGHAVEIKTSLGPSTSIRVSSLDQLDTSGVRRLDILHIRLIEAPDGMSINSLVTQIEDRIATTSDRLAFHNALLRRGLMPGEATGTSPTVQLRSIDGYAVSDSFPKLTRAAVPMAIVDAQYVLDLRALAPFATDASTVLDGFMQENAAQ